MPQGCNREMIFFVVILHFLQERHYKPGFSPRIMTSSELFSYTQEELISIIEQQHGEIQSLPNERGWLHEDSNMQRSQAQECYDKLLEWQAYGNGLTQELENLKKRDEQWKEALTKAVDKLNTERENYSNLENLYFSLKEKNKQLKETLESAFILWRGMYEEYCALYNNYTFLLNYAYWIQSGWIEPIVICQGHKVKRKKILRQPSLQRVQFHLLRPFLPKAGQPSPPTCQPSNPVRARFSSGSIALGMRLLELTPMARFHTCQQFKLHAHRRITLHVHLILRPHA